MAHPWLLNQWQVLLLEHGNQTQMRDENYPSETAIFGCRRFTGRTPTWAEASNRLVYVAHNLRRLDTGSLPHFGSVGVVFRTRAVASQVEIAAVDTGIWEGSCNASFPGPPHLNLDCLARLPPVGTFNHIDHQLLPNLRMWAGRGAGPLPLRSVERQAALLFGRMSLASTRYDALPSMLPFEAAQYWEANIIGNPQFPEAVSFLLPVFGALFGTASGTLVRRLADKHGWPVVWALGDATNGSVSYVTAHVPSHDPSPGPSYDPRLAIARPAAANNGRLLDATTSAAAALNATLPPGSVSVFERVWADAVRERQSLGGEPSPERVRAWWARLLPATERLAPLSAASCTDVDSCIGVSVRDESCVCVRASRPSVRAIKLV